MQGPRKCSDRCWMMRRCAKGSRGMIGMQSKLRLRVCERVRGQHLGRTCRVGEVEPYPKVKQTENAIPTKANDLDRVKGVVTSEMIALKLSEIDDQSYQ